MYPLAQEQKIRDIAHCLIDVLRCASSDASKSFRQGREYLCALLEQLTNMRGRESCYRQQLLTKAEPIINSAIILNVPSDQVYQANGAPGDGLAIKIALSDLYRMSPG